MEITKECFEYILPYHVSLSSSLGDKLLPPDGSGIFVTFSVSSRSGIIPIYGILTAGHVVEKIELITHKKHGGCFIGLSKPCNCLGNTIYTSTYPIDLILWEFDRKYCRYLTQHQHGKEPFYERDISFIGLGSGEFLLQNELIQKSTFYNLDAPIEPKHSWPMVFFRGACLDSEIEDGTLNTEIYVAKKGEFKRYSKSKIPYLEISNPIDKSMSGASGSGLWMVCRDNGAINMSLRGIIVGQTDVIDPEDFGNRKILALDIFYIYEIFLPLLKNKYKTSIINTL